MQIIVLTVGRMHEPYIKPVIELYESRLKRSTKLGWDFVPHAGTADDIERVKARESDAILARLKPEDTVVLLDERGEMWDSPAFAARIDKWQTHARGRLVFVIGGAYGVDGRVSGRAETIWSLSNLVFPHQLVRVLLLEQLYRAYAIQHSLPYHHG